MPIGKFILIIVKIFFFAVAYICLRLTMASASSISSLVLYGAEFITFGALYCAIYAVLDICSEALKIQVPEKPVLSVGLMHWTFVILNLRTVSLIAVTTLIITLIPESCVSRIIKVVHAKLELILN